MGVTTEARSAAHELKRVWRETPLVHRHYDEAKNHWIDVATCADNPVKGVTAVGTVGLSAHDLGFGDLRVEILGAFPSNFDDGANVAATCAFNAIKNGYLIRPDAIHPNVLEHYIASPQLPHILLVDPFLWDEGPRTLRLPTATVAWVMMVPISERERLFSDEHGVDVLATRFERAQIDIFDFSRSSVI